MWVRPSCSSNLARPHRHAATPSPSNCSTRLVSKDVSSDRRPLSWYLSRANAHDTREISVGDSWSSRRGKAAITGSTSSFKGGVFALARVHSSTTGPCASTPPCRPSPYQQHCSRASSQPCCSPYVLALRESLVAVQQQSLLPLWSRAHFYSFAADSSSVLSLCSGAESIDVGVACRM